jgi:hypothetical protein
VRNTVQEAKDSLARARVILIPFFVCKMLVCDVKGLFLNDTHNFCRENSHFA